MIQLNETNFSDTINDGIVLVKYGAKWCGPCKMLDRILESVSKKYESDDSVKICQVDIDECQEMAKSNGISSVPTTMFIKNGEIIRQVVGIQSEQAIVQTLESMK